MDINRDKFLLSAFIEVLEKVGVKVSFENIKIEDIRAVGGRCRIREEEMIIIDVRLTDREKVEILAIELSRMPLENIYIHPSVREEIDKISRTSKKELTY